MIFVSRSLWRLEDQDLRLPTALPKRAYDDLRVAIGFHVRRGEDGVAFEARADIGDFGTRLPLLDEQQESPLSVHAPVLSDRSKCAEDGNQEVIPSVDR